MWVNLLLNVKIFNFIIFLLLKIIFDLKNFNDKKIRKVIYLRKENFFLWEMLFYCII